MISTNIEWFDHLEKLPEEDGCYLVYTDYDVPFTTVRFATKLSDIDDIDFPEELYSQYGGFAYFDESSYRWRVFPPEHIKYWAKIPEIKEEMKDD